VGKGRFSTSWSNLWCVTLAKALPSFNSILRMQILQTTDRLAMNEGSTREQMLQPLNNITDVNKHRRVAAVRTL